MFRGLALVDINLDAVQLPLAFMPAIKSRIMKCPSVGL